MKLHLTLGERCVEAMCNHVVSYLGETVMVLVSDMKILALQHSDQIARLRFNIYLFT